MSETWNAKPIQLKFLLGEVTLFSVTFPALVLDACFTQPRQSTVTPPFDSFSPSLEAFVIRSHPIDSPLPRLVRLPCAVRYVPSQYRHHYIELQGSFADYLKKFSGKSRSTLLRKVRKFADFSGGEVCWREFRNSEEMGEFYRLARELSQKTYQERLLHAGFPEGELFCRAITELAARGLARGYILSCRGQPIAYLFCPICDGVLQYAHLGYDPEFHRWSPGTVLQYMVLESLFAEGTCRVFDFAEGEGSHKEFFSTNSIQCADLYYFRPTVRNLCLLHLHAGMSVLSDAAIMALDQLGLKARLKKLVRSKA